MAAHCCRTEGENVRMKMQMEMEVKNTRNTRKLTVNKRVACVDVTPDQMGIDRGSPSPSHKRLARVACPTSDRGVFVSRFHGRPPPIFKRVSIN
jgi:hypothetical protein